jgi:hypothetical protein
MRRLRLLAFLAIFACSVGWAQRSMSVAQLEQFIKSAVDLKQPDKQVADVLKSVKLTQRLDTRAVENLQGLGAGPRTMDALRILSQASVGMPTPGPAVAAAPAALPPPPPSEAEKLAVLDAATRNSLDYTANLPNFICTQVTRRYVDPTGNGGIRLADTIQEHLSFVEGKEDYKVVLVNNLPVGNLSHNQLGGTTSSGEFGTMLLQVFKPETQTEFRWDRWATLRARRTHVYTFRVMQARSDYRIYDGESGREMIGGYHGTIYVDAETKMVMRLRMDVDGLENFPITAINIDLNYDFVDISGRRYVLPLKAELNSSRGARYKNRNDVEFRRYERFTADATIVFDDTPPEELPKDQLEEQPIR